MSAEVVVLHGEPRPQRSTSALTILLAVAVAVVVVGSVYTVFVIGESGAKAVWSTRV